MYCTRYVCATMYVCVGGVGDREGAKGREPSVPDFRRTTVGDLSTVSQSPVIAKILPGGWCIVYRKDE